MGSYRSPYIQYKHEPWCNYYRPGGWCNCMSGHVSKQDCQIRDLQTRVDRLEDRLGREDRYELQVTDRVTGKILHMQRVDRLSDASNLLQIRIVNCRNGKSKGYLITETFSDKPW